MPLAEQVVADYQTLRLSLKAHPMSFLRRSLRQQGYLAAQDLATTRNHQRVKLAGLVLVRQRPGSAKGVLFITIEDETGVANAILWPDRFEAQRRIVLSASMIGIKGVVQREGEIIHVITARMEDMTLLLHSVGEREFPHRPGPADGAKFSGPDARHTAKRPATPSSGTTDRSLQDPAETIRVKSRNFH
jgi:error-prone DNA polymerase